MAGLLKRVDSFCEKHQYISIPVGTIICISPLLAIDGCFDRHVNNGVRHLKTGEGNSTYNWRNESVTLQQAYLNTLKEWKNLLETTDKNPKQAMWEALEKDGKGMWGIEYNSLKEACKSIEADKNLKSRQDLIDSLSPQIELWEKKLAPKGQDKPVSLKESFSPSPNYAETQQGKQIAANALRFAMRNAFGRG